MSKMQEQYSSEPLFLYNATEQQHLPRLRTIYIFNGDQEWPAVLTRSVSYSKHPYALLY